MQGCRQASIDENATISDTQYREMWDEHNDTQTHAVCILCVVRTGAYNVWPRSEPISSGLPVAGLESFLNLRPGQNSSDPQKVELENAYKCKQIEESSFISLIGVWHIKISR